MTDIKKGRANSQCSFTVGAGRAPVQFRCELSAGRAGADDGDVQSDGLKRPGPARAGRR
jgi:hypothetical protein